MNPLGIASYAEAKDRFRWDQRWRLFDGDKSRFNLANECLDRHIRAGRGDAVGARIISSDGSCDSPSFAELDALVSRVALLLRELGVARGDRVAVRLEPSREFIAAMFAAFRIGAIFVPCTPLLGSDAIRARISDAQPVVTFLETPDDLEEWSPPGKVLCRPELVERAARHAGRVECEPTRPEDPAIYIYSSGTTGTPKRTVLQHQGFTYLTIIVGVFVVGLEPDDRYVACYTPGYLGGFGWGVIVPMTMGTGAGILAGKFDPQGLLRALSEQKMTALHAPPTAYRKLLRSDRGEALELRKLAYTAEAMDEALSRQIEGRFGSYPRGQYGATEIGMIAIDYAFPDYRVRPGAIGQPILGNDVAVIDEQGRRAEVGTVGRIALVRGGKTMFAGDYGMWDADGYLIFKGRSNDTIISSGFTIGAEEVEECLRTHPAVDQAAVIAVPDPERGNVPKAFVQLVESARPADPDARRRLVAELQDHVRDKLGRYAYPREVVFVEEFERNEAGKIRKAALRAA